MKKIVSLLLAVLMLASLLTACGSSEPAATEAPATKAPATTEAPAEAEAPTEAASTAIAPKNGEKYVIAISQPYMGHPIRQAGQKLIDAWAAEHPDCEIIVTDGQLNAQK